VAVRPGPAAATAEFQPLEKVDLFALAGGRHRLIERTYPIRITAQKGGCLELRLSPLVGRALLCGVTLDPVSVP
jgi:hypothetical protein